MDVSKRSSPSGRRNLASGQIEDIAEFFTVAISIPINAFMLMILMGWLHSYASSSWVPPIGFIQSLVVVAILGIAGGALGINNVYRSSRSINRKIAAYISNKTVTPMVDFSRPDDSEEVITYYRENPKEDD